MTLPFKIYICHHDNTPAIQGHGILTPIQGGRSIACPVLPMIGDDTGTHISHKNPLYASLSVQYWAWKNSDADYVGVFHDNAHLLLNTTDKPSISIDSYDDAYYTAYGLSEDGLCTTLPAFDVHLPLLTSVHRLGYKTFLDYILAQGVHDEQWVSAKDIFLEKHPDHADALEDVTASPCGYTHSLLVARRAVFHDYNTWLFDILFALEDALEISTYPDKESQVLYHLGLLFMTLYFKKLQADTQTLRFNACCIGHCSSLPILPIPSTPVMDVGADGVIPIVFSSSNFFCLGLAGVFQSLIDNSSPDYQYRFYLLGSGIMPRTRQLLYEIVHKAPNFTLMFIDASSFLVQYFSGIKFIFGAHIQTIDTYHRLLIPKLFPLYDTMLYLDSDLIILQDVALLYHQDMGGCSLGAALEFGVFPPKGIVRDIIASGKYFNAGVLLFNNKKIRATGREDFYRDVMINDYDSIVVFDQDILNIAFKDDVYIIDSCWNFSTLDVYRFTLFGQGTYESILSKGLADIYLRASSHIAIVHYSDWGKPWIKPARRQAHLYWQYIEKTGFYRRAVNALSDNSDNKADRVVLPLWRKRKLPGKVSYYLLGILLIKRLEYKGVRTLYLLGLPVFKARRKKKALLSNMV